MLNAEDWRSVSSYDEIITIITRVANQIGLVSIDKACQPHELEPSRIEPTYKPPTPIQGHIPPKTPRRIPGADGWDDPTYTIDDA